MSEMPPMSPKALTLPRRLAIRLLHEAQVATEPFAGLVVATSADAEPDRWRPAAAASAIPALAAETAAAGLVPWALYRYEPGLPTAPVAADFSGLPELRRLTASLATKGVLQLRAWELVEGQVIERVLQVRD